MKGGRRQEGERYGGGVREEKREERSGWGEKWGEERSWKRREVGRGEKWGEERSGERRSEGRNTGGERYEEGIWEKKGGKEKDKLGG